MKLTLELAVFVLGMVFLELCQATDNYICKDDIGLNGDELDDLKPNKKASVVWMCSKACHDEASKEGGSCIGINWNPITGECELVTSTTDGETSDANWKYCPNPASNDTRNWCNNKDNQYGDTHVVKPGTRYTSATPFDATSACQDRCTDKCRVAVIQKNDKDVLQCLTLEREIRQLTEITGSTCSTCTYCERSMTFTVMEKWENGNAAEKACSTGETLATLEVEFTEKIERAIEAMHEYEEDNGDSAPTAWVKTDKMENGYGCWYLDRNEGRKEIVGIEAGQCEYAQHHVLCMKYDD